MSYTGRLQRRRLRGGIGCRWREREPWERDPPWEQLPPWTRTNRVLIAALAGNCAPSWPYSSINALVRVYRRRAIEERRRFPTKRMRRKQRKEDARGIERQVRDGGPMGGREEW